VTQENPTRFPKVPQESSSGFQKATQENSAWFPKATQGVAGKDNSLFFSVFPPPRECKWGGLRSFF
jgi:hypothetical protein